MDSELQTLLNNILTNAHGHPLGNDDKRTVYAEDLKALSDWYKRHSGVNQNCKRCDSPLNPQGFCQDETCPYSIWSQDVPNEMFLTEETTIDIFNACASQGIRVKINDGERLSVYDLSACDGCGYVFHDEEVALINGNTLCPDCEFK